MKHEPPIETEDDGASEYSALQPLRLDPEEYRDDLAEFDLTEEQQNQLLQTLWDMMSMMVDIGWGVDAVQMLLPHLFENSGADSEKLIEGKDSKKFNACAKSNNEKGGTHDG